jgi:GTP-binding protein
MKIKTAEFVQGVASWSDLPTGGRPEVAIVGRSNVGKSSLINAMLGRKNLARTSKKPGKTQQLNYFLINRQFYLVDLPGVGYAKVSKKRRAQWEALIERYLSEWMPLRGVVHLVDSRHPPTDYDEDVVLFMKEHDLAYCIALTKTDKLSNNQLNQSLQRARNRLKELGYEVPVIPTSAQTGWGADEVLRWIVDHVT